METDLILWSAGSAIGIAMNGSATYPLQEATSGRMYVPFDDTTVESAVFEGVLPEGYDSDQNIYLDVYYWMASATSGTIDFEASVEAITPDDALDLDAGSSFDTANAANEIVPGTQGYLSVLTIEMSNLDGMAAGDAIRIALERDADDGTDDTATGDCNVCGLRLYQSTE